MAIAGYGQVGADHGYIYIRAEYPSPSSACATIGQAERQLPRRRHCRVQVRFHVEIRVGAGAFVCGEETALIASLRAESSPRPRPPYPAEAGLWHRPTLINVETFANVAPIIRNGGAWYASIGRPSSTGTKVFALAGRVVNSGLVEVPLGTTLGEIVFDIGGGIVDGGTFKAVQTGGPSGGCIPADHLDMPVDYESLAEVGSIMGSGGMIVMDNTSHGRRCQVLHGLLPRRVMRQVRPVPGRHGPAHCPARTDLPRRSHRSDLARLQNLAEMHRDEPVRPRHSASNPVFSTGSSATSTSPTSTTAPARPGFARCRNWRRLDDRPHAPHRRCRRRR